jgi:hypothetical protein
MKKPKMVKIKTFYGIKFPHDKDVDVLGCKKEIKKLFTIFSGRRRALRLTKVDYD